MTTSVILRALTLAVAVVAAPAGAQSTEPLAPPPRPAPPASAQRTVVPVRVHQRAILPTPQPALPSRMQTPTRPVILPPPRMPAPDTSRPVAPRAAAPDVALADVAPAQSAVPAPAPAAVAPLPAINQPGPPPANATGRCKDGTYLTGSAATDANCSTHGGLGVAFPAPSRPPQRTPLRQP